MINLLKNQVGEILRECPETRNSDITLMIKIWVRFYTPYIFGEGSERGSSVRLKDLYELPREDNIKRIRAKFQEEALKRINDGKERGDEQFYLPTDPKVAKQRQINRAIWEKALAYFRKPTSQTEQLPRPVGGLSFRRTGERSFIAQGSEGKEYEVKNPFGHWSCECEAFRFSPAGKECKHIKAVKDYLLQVEKEEAAKNQKPLFQ